MAPRVRRWVHAGLLAVGVGIIVMEATKRLTELGPAVLVMLAVVAAAAMVAVIKRVAAVRLWFRYLSVAPVGFALLLLFASPATAVVFDSEPTPAAITVRHPARVVMIVMDEFPLTSLLDGQGGGLGGEDVQAMLTANGFVNSLRPSTGPQLDFLHVLLPHFPWHYLPTGQDYAALPGHTNGLPGQNWANGQVAALARVRHLLQVQATDTFVGRVVERLRSIGEWDNTLLVLTADHGVPFAPGGPIRGVTKTNTADIAWTPLLIKAPGQRVGGVDDRAAESIDVLPTIASHLGISIPWSVDGRSLIGPARSDAEARTFPMFDWDRSALHPRSGSFLRLDRASVWAEVRKARAAPPNDFADLRVFGTGLDDDLLGVFGTGRVGQPVAGARVVLDGPLRYLGVDQSQPKTPFAAIHGQLRGVRPGTRLAIAVNGVVGGLSAAYQAPGSDHSEFWGTLVPRFFHAGRNLVQVFIVDGPAGRQILHLIPPGTASRLCPKPSGSRNLTRRGHAGYRNRAVVP